MFEIYDANEVIFDKNNFFEKCMAKFKENMKKWKAKRLLIENGTFLDWR